jgi:hypothetical protein
MSVHRWDSVGIATGPWSCWHMRDPELDELQRQLAKAVTGRGIYYPDALASA